MPRNKPGFNRIESKVVKSCKAPFVENEAAAACRLVYVESDAVGDGGACEMGDGVADAVGGVAADARGRRDGSGGELGITNVVDEEKKFPPC